MAPPEIAKDFQSFLVKLQSTSTSASNPSSNPKTQTPADSAQGKVDRATESSSKTEDVWKGKPAPPVDFENFWEAPESLWKPKEWSDREIEAIMASQVLTLLFAIRKPRKPSSCLAVAALLGVLAWRVCTGWPSGGIPYRATWSWLVAMRSYDNR